MSVLSSVTPQSFSNSLLLLQLDRFNAQKLQREQKNISSSINQQVTSINLEANKYRKLKNELSDAIDFINSTVARGDNIGKFLDKMATVTFNANYGIPLSFTSYSATFDSYLKRINNEAEETRLSPNLLGSSPQSDFTYRYQVNGAAKTLEKTYAGSDYYIKEAGDYVWRRDQDLSQLKRFVFSTGVYTGVFSNLSSGAIRLDAFTAATDNVTFTTSFDTAGATQYSGAITRSGLKVLDAWLYEGLSTESSRARAAEDLHDAEDILLGAITSFTSAKTTAGYYAGQADIKLGDFNSQINEKTAAGLVKLQAAEDNSFRRNLINAEIINSAVNVRNQYLEAISLGKNGDLTKALIDILT